MKDLEREQPSHAQSQLGHRLDAVCPGCQESIPDAMLAAARESQMRIFQCPPDGCLETVTLGAAIARESLIP